MSRVLLIDNIDSFVFNVSQALQILGADVLVHRNDALTVEEALALQPTHIVISPGPGRPEEAGISPALILAALDANIPLLGICLGHQALVQVLGGSIGSAPELMHGKKDAILHDGKGLFSTVGSPMEAGRYHSLVASTVPDCLEITARTADGTVMAVRHRSKPAVGLQFHPESILTPEGNTLLNAFLTETA